MAGLSAAYRLEQAGVRTTVFEAEDHVGGRVTTIRKGDFLMDLGAAVYLGTYRDAIALIKEVGLGEELQERPAIGAMPRDGRVHHFDYGTPFRTALTTKALSWKAKLRAVKVARLLLKHRNNLGYYDYSGITVLDTVSTKQFAERELGQELSDYLAEPLVRGTWAADDGESSNALMLWTVRNMLVPTVFNLDSGCDTLARVLAKSSEVRLSTPVTHLSDRGTHVEVTSGVGEAESTERFDGAIIATTAPRALAIQPDMPAYQREYYASTRYRGLITVCVGLSIAPTDPATYILIPRREDPDAIAVIADHIKAAGRAPAGKSLYTVLFSHEYLWANTDKPDAEVVADAVATISRYHGDITPHIEETAIKRWEEVVPVVHTGDFTKMNTYKQRIDATARVQYAGDFDRIPGLNGAAVSGTEAAARILANHRAWSGASV
jgi:oxygen-dependent protoporphyrinogen oxidase